MSITLVVILAVLFFAALYLVREARGILLWNTLAALRKKDEIIKKSKKALKLYERRILESKRDYFIGRGWPNEIIIYLNFTSGDPEKFENNVLEYFVHSPLISVFLYQKVFKHYPGVIDKVNFYMFSPGTEGLEKDAKIECFYVGNQMVFTDVGGELGIRPLTKQTPVENKD